MMKQRITHKMDFIDFTTIKLHATVVSVNFYKFFRQFID